MKSLILLLTMLFAVNGWAAKITDDNLIIGKPGSSNNVDIKNTTGQNILRINQTSNEWEFSNDSGTNFAAIGSGSGGGGGENFNNGFTSNDNANAEKGTTGWSETGGTFATTTTDPLEGKQSFTWTPTAQNEYVASPTLDLDKDLFRGNSCEARVEYIGGDENLELHVVDGNGDILNEDVPGNRVIPARTTFGTHSVFFLCPSQADITGDANKGNVQYRIVNNGASAAPLIKWDKSYLGTLRGLSETVLPDTFTAQIAANGTITSETPSFISGISKTTGNYTITWQAGLFTEPPTVVTTVSDGAGNCRINRNFGISATQMNVTTFDANGTTLTDCAFHLNLQKAGADAKQSVQIFKSIPRVAENTNIFSARMDASGFISNENVDFINGNCSDASTLSTCSFVSGIFNEVPTCYFTENTGTSTPTAVRVSTNNSTSQVIFETSRAGSILCIKQGADFLKGKTQNISLAGIAVNSYAEQSQKQVRVESCEILSNGATNSSLCSSWVDSVSTTGGTGVKFITFVPGVFSSAVNCNATPAGITPTSVDLNASMDLETSSSARVTTMSNAARSNFNFNIICIGEK